MTLTINSNVASSRVIHALRTNRAAATTALTRLSTGLRINSGADDPAGLIAALGLSREIVEIDGQLSADTRSYYDAAAADGKLGEFSNLLLQAKSLTVANANTAGTTPEERAANQMQLDAIVNQVDRLAAANSGSTSGRFASSAHAAANLGITTIDHKTYTLADLRTGGALAATSPDSSSVAADQVVAKAIQQIAKTRAEVGVTMKYS